MKGLLIVLCVIFVILLSGCTTQEPETTAPPAGAGGNGAEEAPNASPAINPKQASSQLEIKFLSREKWDEKSIAGTLTRSAVASVDTPGAANLSLSTEDQPIKAGDGFSIGIKLEIMEKGKDIAPPIRVEVDVPDEFGSPGCHKDIEAEVGRIVWEIAEGGDFDGKPVYCEFYPGIEDIILFKQSSRKYLVTANAEYELRPLSS